MATGLTLIISTPLDVVLRAENVWSVRAEDASGGFGIMPGHVPLLTVLDACVVRWRRRKGKWSYCSLRGGVLTTQDGNELRIACREAVLGDDLLALQAAVDAHLAAKTEEMRAARLQQTRMHAQAIRQIMRLLAGGSDLTTEATMEGMLR